MTKKIVRRPLIISLTSFPPRINTVHLTIDSLMRQTMRADKIILWLSDTEFPKRESELPQTLLDLTHRGLEIRWCENTRSYKKLIPTLTQFPDAPIITADDDVIYPDDMVELLYRSYLRHPGDVHCHRATKFVLKDGKFHTIAGGRDYYHRASFLNKPTGVGGVLYPPHCFGPDILKMDLVQKLAPTNDDQWFWLQAALNNVRVRVVKTPRYQLNYTPDSQEVGLYLINDCGENLFWKDFNNMMAHYPQLQQRLLDEADKMSKTRHFVCRRRFPDGRREIFVGGVRILSYRKKSRRAAVKNTKPAKTETAAPAATTPSPRYVSNDRLAVFLRDRFMERTGKLPTEELTTFNEKIIWAAMYDVTPLKVQCADKLAVRDYVAQTVGDKYLPKLYGAYRNSDEFNPAELPQSFMLTFNAGSGQNMIVTDASKLDINAVRQQIRRWLCYNHSEPFCEMQYRDIPPRVIARELVDIRTDIEYKLWCFGGRVEFIVLNSYQNGHNDIRVQTRDKDWNDMGFNQIGQGITGTIASSVARPKFLGEMIDMAEKLAAPFDFVRVDFYETKSGELVFGELTFSPTAGMLEYAPNNDAVQKRLGAMFKIPSRDENGFAKR